MSAVTRKQFLTRLQEIGYGPLADDDLERHPYGYWTWSLFAPRGLIFYASQCHSLCGSAETKTEAYAAILADIGAGGLVPCDQRPCDTCDPGGMTP